MAISAGGSSYTCGIATGGAAYCWGRGLYGVLGNGSSLNEAHSTPVPVAGALRFTAIAAGLDHTCALQVDGAAYCWGNNAQPQLGVSSTTELCFTEHKDSSLPCSTIPVQVSGDQSFVSITLGDTFTCGLNKVGDAYCWGDNSWGTLGNGDRNLRSSATPVRVLR